MESRRGFLRDAQAQNLKAAAEVVEAEMEAAEGCRLCPDRISANLLQSALS
jgi:hypothetical protein